MQIWEVLRAEGLSLFLLWSPEGKYVIGTCHTSISNKFSDTSYREDGGPKFLKFSLEYTQLDDVWECIKGVSEQTDWISWLRSLLQRGKVNRSRGLCGRQPEWDTHKEHGSQAVHSPGGSHPRTWSACPTDKGLESGSEIYILEIIPANPCRTLKGKAVGLQLSPVWFSAQTSYT